MRSFTRLVLGLVLASLAGFSTAAAPVLTEDTVYLQCENKALRGDMTFLAVTSATKEARIFVNTSKRWTGALPMTVTPTIYMFELLDGYILMLNRNNLRLDQLVEQLLISTSNCIIVEQGAAERYVKNNPKPKPKI